MLHLAYQPLLPTGSKYLQLKWDQASYDMHRRKVKSAKPTINTTPPTTYNHLALKQKKQKLEEQRMMKIQKENNMLLEKISHIMRTTGRIDNRNDYERKSLGRERRQLEMLRITKENQMILFRLSQCRPHYNVRIWHEDWLKTLKVMDSIARYPRGWAQQQKDKEKSCQKSSDCENEEKTSTDATGRTAESNTTSGKAESEEKGERKDASKEEAEALVQGGAGTHTAPKLSAPDLITNTRNKHPHAAESSPSSDKTEMSNTPNTTRVSRPCTPDTQTHEQETAGSDYKDTT
ncbi:uncharacterized protein CFAP97D1 [Myripristis murdjan]|uniref:uncharacterized protein CFAP97D1 n=1 Tax=Myripristis murdjan TaxID=586833 RepID=UPI001175D24E|nr:uncharacterized protein CFAP97D1-like [Myripristis murdjan]